MMIDNNQTGCGDNFVMYINIKSLGYTPNIDAILYTNDSLIKYKCFQEFQIEIPQEEFLISTKSLWLQYFGGGEGLRFYPFESGSVQTGWPSIQTVFLHVPSFYQKLFPLPNSFGCQSSLTSSIEELQSRCWSGNNLKLITTQNFTKAQLRERIIMDSGLKYLQSILPSKQSKMFSSIKPDQQSSTNLTTSSEIHTRVELLFTELGFGVSYTL